MDVAGVFGDDTLIDFDEQDSGDLLVDSVRDQDVRGWALDAGLSWRTKLPGRPAFTVAYARGLGDDDRDDGTDHSFRQTGLQDNTYKFFGVDRFRYYGELLRPELSNLQVITLGLGFRLLENSSIEILYHDYRQIDPSPSLRDNRLNADPLGRSTHIGNELDIVIGLEEWKHLELELVGSMFRAGSAFGDRAGNKTWQLSFELNYNF